MFQMSLQYSEIYKVCQGRKLTIYVLFLFLGKVVDTTVVAVTDVKNSNAMEKEGFVRMLERLQNFNFQLKSTQFRLTDIPK